MTGDAAIVVCYYTQWMSLFDHQVRLLLRLHFVHTSLVFHSIPKFLVGRVHSALFVEHSARY